jgi:hypothetical protein
MSSIAIILLALVGFFVFVLFVTVVGVVIWGAAKLLKPKAAAAVAELQSIDVTDGIDAREAEIIARYAAIAKDLLIKQVIANKHAEAKETLAKAIAT